MIAARYPDARRGLVRPVWTLTRLAVVGAALFGAAACGDAVPTAPLGPGPLAAAAQRNAGPGDDGSTGSAADRRGAPRHDSRILSRTVLGDTVITVFVVGTGGPHGATFNLGSFGRINFPRGMGSICDLATSSYGPGTWDDPCTPSAKPVTITARVWVNGATGTLSSDFEPAMRFVPGLDRGVTLHLKDRWLAPTDRLDYCSNGVCVDEAASDPSLVTQLDRPNGFAYRLIKHFSGYSVVVD